MGQAVPSAARSVSSPADPRRRNRLIVLIVAIVMAVVVASGVVIVPNRNTVAIMLGLHGNNPIMVTADAINSLSGLKSAKYTASITLNDAYGDSNNLSADGYFRLADTTDSSSADTTFTVTNTTESYSGRFAWYGGAYAVSSGDDYDYASPDDVRDQLSSLDCGPAWVSAKNALVSKGRLDVDNAGRVFAEQCATNQSAGNGSGSSGAGNGSDGASTASGEPSDTVKKQMGAAATQFLVKELDNKDIQAAVFPVNETSRAGSGTTLHYQLDVEQLVRAFARFWQGNQDSYPDLRKYVEDTFKRDNPDYSYDKALDDLASWEAGPSELTSLDVTLNYGFGRQLNRLDMTASGDEAAGSVSFSLAVGQRNAVNANQADTLRFMEGAKQDS
ncbi:hypothetical protein DF200_03495 [Bifidobacterium catulorum]|uniref:Uncharacterized protein n=2 Tax=Bifidobacterium catulorum TaxID=1630173 RepID=A0A2U2MTU6_9BIFI|nr:hypothetical protein DF200_03495 [Bifidobacterium catulorum]